MKSAADRVGSQADLGLLLVGAVSFGCRPLFARLVFADGMSPAVAGLLTLVPTAALCLLLAAGIGGMRRVAWASAFWAVFAGAFVASGSLAYLYALRALPVATTTLIHFSYPLFVVLLGWGLLRIRPSRSMIVAAGLILLGCAVLIPTSSERLPDLGPVLICFISPLSYALLLLLLSRRLTALPILPRVGLIALGASLILLPASGLGGFTAFAALGPDGWLGVAGLVLVCGFLPQLTTTVGVPLAGADRAAVVGGLELITALLIGWIAIGEPIATREIVGALLIGAAMALAR